MSFITKNMKAARIFNSILLIAAVVLCVLQLIQTYSHSSGSTAYTLYSVSQLLYYIVYILAVVFGFLYMFGYYKKDAAKFYRGFMFLFSLSTLLLIVYDLITTKVGGYGSGISGILSAVVCVDAFLLTFAKDLGRKTSIGLAISILVIKLFSAVRVFILYPDLLGVVTNGVMGIAIACIACLFVLAKYADKAERGAN